MAADGTLDFKGHRWFAALHDTLSRGLERTYMPRHRTYIHGEAQGRVLEVGAGTGSSFSYYTKAEKVVATEPDPFMLERARKRLSELGLTHIEVAQHLAEDLPFEDHSFDHVVSSLVFCTVREPQRALAEVKRLLKPGGTFRFIEHIRYEEGLRGKVQDVITPLWRWMAAGCHPNRRTLEAVQGAGFQVQDLRRYTLRSVPLVVGVATAP